MTNGCGICGQYGNKYICTQCALMNYQNLQGEINQQKKQIEGLTIWVNELLERLAVQLANDSFRVLKREEV